MPVLQLRSWIVPGLLLTSLLVGIGLLLGQSFLQNERAAYERGAAIAALHFHCRGTFPAAADLARIFSLGGPKTCTDLDKMDERKGREPTASAQ
jgi:hypothetical protein